jgi:predicted O-methyltransferase YrrM
VQKKLIEETMKHPRSFMLGAPEVLQLNQMLIRAIGAKKVLDVGVFTGSSSLSAALALPDDGIVIGCEVSEEYASIGKGVKNSGILKSC